MFIKELGHSVAGYDLIAKSLPIKVFTKEVPFSDVYVITVSTRLNDFSQVEDVCSKILPHPLYFRHVKFTIKCG